MSWIDEELNRRKQQDELCKHAQELRNAVWSEIEERAIEAQGKGFRLLIPDGESVTFPQTKGGAPKTLTVRVGRDGCSVEASNGIRFALGYNGDSPSLIQADSRTAIPIEEAARLILKPFLFP